MISIDATNLLVEYVGTLVPRCPPSWERFVLYEEFAKDEDGELLHLRTQEVWTNGNVSYEYSCSAEAELASVAFYEQCIKEEEMWTGLRLEIANSGTYATKFYYGSTPLIDADYEEMEKRVAEQ